MQSGKGSRRGPSRSRRGACPSAAAPLLLALASLLHLSLSAPAIPATESDPVSPAGWQGEPVIPVTYYGEIGCSHCGTFGGTLPYLEERYGVEFEVEIRDVLRPASFEMCRRRLGSLGRPFNGFPVLLVGNNAYQGQAAIEAGLTAELQHLLEYGSYRPQVPPALDGSAPAPGFARAQPFPGLRQTLPLLPIIAAGLADGINPCAFAAMLFLLSLLAMLGRRRREMLLVGLIYGTTIFCTYFALGWGLLEALRQAMDVELLRGLLRTAVSVGTGLLALLTLRDVLLIRSGRSSAALLQLSPAAKRRIHALMRWEANRGDGRGGERGKGAGRTGEHRRSRGLSRIARPFAVAAGTAAVAFLVSLLELACTGQLYLPTIAYLLQTGRPGAGEISALLLYNTAFILPLLLLFAAVYSGLSLTALSRWYRRKAAVAKLLSVGILFLLAIGIWLV